MGQCKSSVEVISEVKKELQQEGKSYDLAPLTLTCTESTTTESVTLAHGKRDHFHSFDHKENDLGNEIVEVSMEHEREINSSPNSIFSSKSFHSPVAFKLCPISGQLFAVTSTSKELELSTGIKRTSKPTRNITSQTSVAMSYFQSRDESSTLLEGISSNSLIKSSNDLLLFESDDFGSVDFEESRDDIDTGRTEVDIRDNNLDCERGCGVQSSYEKSLYAFAKRNIASKVQPSARRFSETYKTSNY